MNLIQLDLLQAATIILIFLVVVRYFNLILSAHKVSNFLFLAITLLLAAFAFLNCLPNNKWGIMNMNYNTAVIYACFVSILYVEKIRYKVLYSTFLIVIATFSMTAMFHISMLMSQKQFYQHPLYSGNTWQTLLDSILLNLLFLILFFAFAAMAARFLKYIKAQIPMHMIILLMTIPCISTIGFLLLLTDDIKNIRIISFSSLLIRTIVILCILYANFVEFYLFKMVVNHLNTNAEIEILRVQMQVQGRFYQNLKEEQTETKKIRHDMKHQIMAIDILIQQRKYQEVEDVLGEILRKFDIQESSISIESGNPQLDAILSLKCTQARKAGVQVESKVMVASGLRLPFLDLCILLGNAMDNAIEACQKLTPEKRLIELEMGSSHQTIWINIVNPISEITEQEFKADVTDKQDKNDHGFGLKSISYIAEKYNGLSKVKIESHRFCLKVVLQNPV